MIMSEMLDLAECRYGMSVSVRPAGGSWEALTHYRHRWEYSHALKLARLEGR